MLRLAGLLAVVAGGAQCADTTGSVPQPCGEAGCPVGLECVAATCVGETGPAYPIALRIVPPDSTPLASAELGPLQLTQAISALDAPVRLDEVVSVGGSVTAEVLTEAGQTTTTTLPVRRIVLEPLNGILAQPLLVEGEFSAIIPNFFSLGLTNTWPLADGGRAQVEYQVRVALRDLPPWQDRLAWDREQLQVAIPTPLSANMPTITGEVRALGLPIRAVRVVALDEATGRQISNESDTDVEGRFAVRLWPTGGEQSAILSFVSVDPARPLPSHAEPVTAPASGESAPVLVELPVPGQSARLTLRALRPVGDTQLPAAGVEVVMRRRFATGEHVVRGRTDANGQFSALGFPGAYQVDLRPSASSANRISRRVLDFSDGAADAVLRPRTAISGAIVDRDGRPVADARISAVLQSAAWADESLIVTDEAPPRRVFESRSGADGAFLLNLDPGRHRIQVAPPEGSGMPPFITALEFQGDQPRTDVEVRLPAGAVLSGTIEGTEAEQIANARVDVWVLSDPPVRLTRARTAADGSFQVRLPVRLQ